MNTPTLETIQRAVEAIAAKQHSLEDIRQVVEEVVKRQLAQQHELETRYVSYDELAKVTGISVRRLKQMRAAKVLTPLAEFGNQVRFELRTALKDLRTRLPKPKRNPPPSRSVKDSTTSARIV